MSYKEAARSQKHRDMMTTEEGVGSSRGREKGDKTREHNARDNIMANHWSRVT